MEKKRHTYLGVYAILVDGDQRILLTTKVGSSPYRGLLDLPGGGMEFGETVEETLRRELKEEVMLEMDQMQLIVNATHCLVGEHMMFHHIGLIYKVQGWRTIPGLVPEDAFDWYPLQQLETARLTPFAKVAVQLQL